MAGCAKQVPEIAQRLRMVGMKPQYRQVRGLGALEVAGVLVRKPEVVEHAGMRARRGEDRLVCLDGLRETPLFARKVAELEACVGITGLERQSAPQRLLGVLRMPIAEKRPQQRPSPTVFRIEADRSASASECHVVLAPFPRSMSVAQRNAGLVGSVRSGHGQKSWCRYKLFSPVRQLACGTTAARPARKCARSATGLPVAPLSSPLFDAVPAMSRCTHG